MIFARSCAARRAAASASCDGKAEARRGRRAGERRRSWQFPEAGRRREGRLSSAPRAMTMALCGKQQPDDGLSHARPARRPGSSANALESCAERAVRATTHARDTNESGDRAHAAGGIPADQSAARHGERQGERSRDEGGARRRRRGRAHHRRLAARTWPACCASASARCSNGTRTAQVDRLGRLRRASPDATRPRLAAKFQVNVTMAAEKFATLLRVANAGPPARRNSSSTPVRAGGAEAKALGYRHALGRARQGVGQPRVPHAAGVELRDDPADRRADDGATPRQRRSDALPPVALATNAQVAELMDDMLVFQSDTRNTMFGLVCVLASSRSPRSPSASRCSSADGAPRGVAILATLSARRKDVVDEPARLHGPHGGHHRRREGHRPRRGAAARRAAARKVALWDRDEQALARGEARALGAAAHVFAARRPDAPRCRARRRSATAEALGGIDVLVCSAGITGPNSPLADYPVDDWKRCSTSTCTACSCATARWCRVMQRKDYGRIVNIASVAGKEGNPERIGVQRVEGGGDRPHQVAGQGAREHRHPRELRDARRGAHRRSSTR